MKIVRSEDPVDSATKELSRLFEIHDGGPILFLSSGGSCLEILNRDIFVPKQLTLSVVDERWATDPTESNFLRCERSPFFTKAVASGARPLRPVPGKGETLDATAARFEHDLRNWITAYPDGAFITTLGVGKDGHIAGIAPFPGEPEVFHELFEGDRWVVGYDSKGRLEPSMRITTTFTFLKKVTNAVLLAAGQEKRDVLERLKAGTRACDLPVMSALSLPVVAFTS